MRLCTRAHTHTRARAHARVQRVIWTPGSGAGHGLAKKRPESAKRKAKGAGNLKAAQTQKYGRSFPSSPNTHTHTHAHIHTHTHTHTPTSALPLYQLAHCRYTNLPAASAVCPSGNRCVCTSYALHLHKQARCLGHLPVRE